MKRIILVLLLSVMLLLTGCVSKLQNSPSFTSSDVFRENCENLEQKVSVMVEGCFQ